MHAQSDQQGTLYIEKRDGTTIKIPITPGYPQLKSEEEGARMVIQKNKTQFVELVSADIKHIYATIETSGIATMTAEDDSLQYDLYHHQSMVPQVEDGKVVWTFNYERPIYSFGDEFLGFEQYSQKIDNLKSIDFYTPEQSLARARQALVDFYNATDGDHWKINTNWCSDKPIEEWYGVSTGAYSGTPGFPYVNELRLEDDNLQGTFPDGRIFARMGPIIDIALWNNKLTGPIPENLYLNYSLDRLYVGDNQLTGSIPESLMANPLFESLEVFNNKLSGPIPASIARLMDYQSSPRVDISGNDFSGVYRPTWNSMMRYNDIPFNAPSREAIYKYVMQESEGPAWQYDYETFVKFDEKGRNQFTAALNKQNAPSRKVAGDTTKQDDAQQDDQQRSLPPRIINSTWSEALSNPANNFQLRELYNR